MHARLPNALERDQGEAVLRREWRFERLGWGALALILLAGAVGVFGDGIVAAASYATADGTAVLRYDRVIRRDALAELELRLAAVSPSDSVVVISLSEDYLTAMDVQRVIPEPILVRASSGRVEYHLLRLAPSRSMVVRFSVRANAIGTRHATLGVDGHMMSFRQFVLP
jgi:hypothetical protein